MTGPTLFIAQVIVAPEWLDVANMKLDDDMFCAVVTWRGGDRYSVNQGTAGFRFLSRAGNWKLTVQPFQRHQYRFTYAEALDAAARAVSGEGLKVNGLTHAEWEAHFGRVAANQEIKA